MKVKAGFGGVALSPQTALPCDRRPNVPQIRSGSSLFASRALKHADRTPSYLVHCLYTNKLDRAVNYDVACQTEP